MECSLEIPIAIGVSGRNSMCTVAVEQMSHVRKRPLVMSESDNCSSKLEPNVLRYILFDGIFCSLVLRQRSFKNKRLLAGVRERLHDITVPIFVAHAHLHFVLHPGHNLLLVAVNRWR